MQSTREKHIIPPEDQNHKRIGRHRLPMRTAHWHLPLISITDIQLQCRCRTMYQKQQITTEGKAQQKVNNQNR